MSLCETDAEAIESAADWGDTKVKTGDGSGANEGAGWRTSCLIGGISLGTNVGTCRTVGACDTKAAAPAGKHRCLRVATGGGVVVLAST